MKESGAALAAAHTIRKGGVPMRRFSLGLFVGMVLGMSAVVANKNSKQLIKKAKNALNI